MEFDPEKDKKNLAKHGISLVRAADLDLDQALVREDTRFDYGERRWIAIGPIDGALYVLVFTRRPQLRAISLRPANEKETKLWLS